MSFLCSLAVMILASLLLGSLCRRVGVPPLLAMLLVGVVTGPSVLGLLSPSLLAISEPLRSFALVVILARAGLSLDVSDLRAVGRPAILLSFLPASFEILGYMIFAPMFLSLTVAESALAGAVMGAVSPAVVVPRMLRLREEGYGVDKKIPQTITAGASCDDVFVIALFSALLTTAETGTFDASVILRVPVSVLLGIGGGILLGGLLTLLFTRVSVRDTEKVLIFLSVAFLLLTLEDAISSAVPFSALLSVISVGILMNRRAPTCAKRLSARFEKLWVFAEILLFALVGAEVNLSYAVSSGLKILPVVLLALLFRSVGVLLSLAGTKLNKKERLFTVLSYLPKATVQAAIGGVALSSGLACGEVILTAAVLAILLTAPLGALAIDLSGRRLLTKET